MKIASERRGYEGKWIARNIIATIPTYGVLQHEYPPYVAVHHSLFASFSVFFKQVVLLAGHIYQHLWGIYIKNML